MSRRAAATAAGLLLAAAAVAAGDPAPSEVAGPSEAPASPETTVPATGGDVERGRRLADLAGCVSCHTAPGGAPWAGGYAIETAFGTFYGTNVTQDPEHGIGRWTFEDFRRALREGRAPDGTPYYPAFPYPSFTKLSDEDIADLWAFFRTLPPVPQPDRPHEVLSKYASRVVLWAWRKMEFVEGPFVPDPTQSPEWNRGAYLVLAVGHCGECHTPRNKVGGLREEAWLAGSNAKPEPSPNITASPEGIGDWSDADFETFFTMGMTPEGDFVGGEMGRIVREGLAKLPPADRQAIVTYLRSVQPPKR